MKAFVMTKIGRTAWIDKPRPSCGDFDAIVRPLALAPSLLRTRCKAL